MQKQATLLQRLQDQLTMTKIQNEVLETGFDRLSQLVNDTIRPKLETLLADHDNASSMSDVEEIPRDLSVLPAHLRELTPSPNHFDLEHNQHNASGFNSAHHTFHNPQIHLDHRLSTLENHFGTVQAQLSDLDARSSLALMNETLRIREELAQINGAMYSTRAQVQWLLNRERLVGQREAMRGRVGAAPVTANSSAVESGGTGEVGGSDWI
ncbi:hypothetical protein LTR51_000545 [Lithohypha guttulata]|uniref:Uncharacterized protein n=2 Tax=Lithohypha guttulata TaxID=1690604 RepID=A0AAN7SZA3_9EURO|nr:hypothetical protein LTR51_000545 [Lithohypha guttulata]KAK5085733.1 hypothetical protein LTR05_005021 [Lithohypha guttulata]